MESYATMLLRQGKRLEAIELFRKANYSEKSAQLLFKLAFEEVETNAAPSVLKRLFVMAAMEIERYKANSLSLHGLMVIKIWVIVFHYLTGKFRNLQLWYLAILKCPWRIQNS